MAAVLSNYSARWETVSRRSGVTAVCDKPMLVATVRGDITAAGLKVRHRRGIGINCGTRGSAHTPVIIIATDL